MSASIVAAHGAHDGSRANQAVEELVRALNHGMPAARFRPAFNLGRPTFGECAPGIEPGTVVLPLFMSEGYFVQQRIAPVFGASGAAVAPALGLQPGVLAPVLQRALSTIASQRGAVVVVLGHGARRHAGNAAATRAFADTLRATTRRSVRVAYLDQMPSLSDVLERCGDARIVLVPLLLGGGAHERDDIPRLIAKRTAPTTVVSATLLDHPQLTDRVEMLWQTARKRYPLRLGTRGSKLALWQARYVAQRLVDVGVPTRIVVIETVGDRDVDRPIELFDTAGPFTDDLEDALSAGTIDLAVHSLKDLPVRADLLGSVAAVPVRGPVGETLVSRDGRTLADLPSGARIGTSSPRRAAQICWHRSDLCLLPIRGNVERRVAQVLSGRYDATVLAAAGLERIGLAARIAERFPIEAFVPQAGQGALAVQIRPDDWFARAVCSRIDAPAIRRAVRAELRFAHTIEQLGRVAAASAVSSDDQLQLHAAIIGPEDGSYRHGSFIGSDEGAVVSEAVRSLVGSTAAVSALAEVDS